MRPQRIVGSTRDHGGVPLTLVTGPANAEKARVVLDGYRAALARGQEPILVVPTPAGPRGGGAVPRRAPARRRGPLPHGARRDGGRVRRARRAVRVARRGGR